MHDYVFERVVDRYRDQHGEPKKPNDLDKILDCSVFFINCKSIFFMILYRQNKLKTTKSLNYVVHFNPESVYTLDIN